MAIVSSPIRFSRGSLGNLNFHRDKQGRCIARQNPPKVKNFYDNPRRTHQVDSAREFGFNTRLASRLRQPLENYVRYCSDASYFNRLVGLLTKCTETDSLSTRGRRLSVRGNIHLIENFEFNKNNHLSHALRAEFSHTIDENTGHVRVDISSIAPLLDIKGPSNATYFQIVAVATACTTDDIHFAQEVTNLLPFTKEETGPLTLSFTLEKFQGDVFTLSLGVLFYEQYQGVPLLLREGAMSIIEVRKLWKETPKYDATTGRRINDDGKPINYESIQNEFNHKLQLRYELPIISGQNNKAPAGEIDDSLHRLRQLYYRQELDRYRKG